MSLIKYEISNLNEKGIQNVEGLWIETSKTIQNCLIEIRDSLTIIQEQIVSTPNVESQTTMNEDIKIENVVIKSEDINAIIQRIQTNLDNKVFINKLHESPSHFFNSFFHGLTSSALGKDSFRNFYEHIGPTSQCKYTQVAMNKFIKTQDLNLKPYFTDWDKCYICGLPINDGPKGENYSRECEHILPAFTALGHYGLVQTSCEMTDADIDFYRLEYANAHRCCNRLKTGDIWITYDETTKSYFVNEGIIRNTYEQILISKSHDCPEIYNAIKKELKSSNITNENWINKRIGFVRLAYLNKLCDKINGERKDK